MKYGQAFEKESVPEWSFHNLDYNSLKQFIKLHTTHGKAQAISIPGCLDTKLRKFEDSLYNELLRQHDRIGLFVTSKVDEISRRLQYLSRQADSLVMRCATHPVHGKALKRQRKYVHCEQALLQCRDDIEALQRFVRAQIIAIRKILKKYRKWTGSTCLGIRFKDTVLSKPKSFTRQDLSQLQELMDNTLTNLRAVKPATSSGLNFPPVEHGIADGVEDERLWRDTIDAECAEHGAMNVGRRYWNEYDNGSEADGIEYGSDSHFFISADPSTSMPGFFTSALHKLMAWRADKEDENRRSERASLLGHSSSWSYSSTGHRRFDADCLFTDTEAGDENPIRHGARWGTTCGHAELSAELAREEVRQYNAMAKFRDTTLCWGAVASLAMSLVLLTAAELMITSGRHKHRVEVDAGVVVCVAASLSCACAALGFDLARDPSPNWSRKLLVWTAFGLICVLDGKLLIHVATDTA